MRVIETSLEEDLSLLSSYLWQQRIRHRIFEEQGRQVVDIQDRDAAPMVRSTYQSWKDGTLILQRSTPVAGENSRRTAAAIDRLTKALNTYPVLGSLLIVAIVVFPFSAPVSDGELTAVASWLTLIDLNQPVVAGLGALITSAEIWRWFTPVLLHFSAVHLLFNVAVMTDLARRVESVRGSLELAAIVVVIGVVSNIGQYAFTHNPLFGGLSGVAYDFLATYSSNSVASLAKPAGRFILALHSVC